MTVTRHGNNAHAELSPCPFCGQWAWRTGSTYISTFTQCCYTCGTPGCDGMAMAIFCGIGLAVMFQRAAGEFDTITVPPDASAWLNAGIRALRSADINECIHAGRECPTELIIDAPPPAAPGVALYGDGGWTVAGLQTDLAPAFSARVAEVKRWNSVRGEDHPEPE